MECKRCGKKLIGKQISYCSQYCSKLHLKMLYKKRKREQINAYNRFYRKFIKRDKNLRGKMGNQKKEFMLSNFECRKCKKKENLTLNHIIPLSAGGEDKKDNWEILCLKCNIKEYTDLIKKALKEYFKQK